ncbi:MAG: NFACT family protein [Candidatus Micrarchaeia archaeon]|jgi:predicted ribosome quality control (RQC) complex YloA/Tae2 family protein
MQKMSGADLSYMMLELASLQGKRIARIRKTADGIFLFKIGSDELLFQPGVRLHLTRQALQATDAPDGFVGFLRKNLEGKTAQQIARVEGERIVEITTRSKERLIFELFRKGNLVLVGEDGLVYACLLTDDAGGRRVARGEKYEYPKATPFVQKTPEKVAFCVQENAKGEPVSFSIDAAKGGKVFPALCEALDYYYANQRDESGAQKAAAEKMEKLQQRLSSQEGTLAEIEKERVEVKAAAAEVSRNFDRLEGLLSLVRKMKKEGKGDDEINRAIADYKASVKGAELEVEV